MSQPPSRPHTVVVVGGGISGMTAAHELAERGFRVHVVERRDRPGGKARSYPAHGTGTCDGLPAEHGFRFFPSFYRHTDDTLARIPYGDGVVLDQLVSCEAGILATEGTPLAKNLVRLPRDLDELRIMLGMAEAFRSNGLTDEEIGAAGRALGRVLATGRERRFAELEGTSWWDHLGCDARSEAFRLFFASGQIQNTVACKAEDVSARTAGVLGLRLLLDMHLPGRSGDRVLTGPTSEVFLAPWHRLLRDLGVRWHGSTRAVALELSDGQVTGVRVADDSGERVLPCDHVVVALPVGPASELLAGEVRRLDPSLARLDALREHTAWMVGIQFYVADPLPLPHGHVNCVGSEWALTAVAQERLWPDVDLRAASDGRVGGLLSVDISAMDLPARSDGPAGGRVARDCLPDEIAAEVWDQLRRFLGADVLPEQPVGWSLDEGIAVVRDAHGARITNEDPLFINRAGGWALRLDTRTAVPNLFLAGDHVRTHTDLATMEAANESGRRAVNAILHATGHPSLPCGVWDPDARHPGRVLRWLDDRRFRRGLPWVPPAQAASEELRWARHRVRARLTAPLKRAASRVTRRIASAGAGPIGPDELLRRNGAPDSRPFASAQRWRDLLFVHFPVEAEALRAMLPAPLELDLYEGQAWISLVAMHTDHLTVPGVGSRGPWRGFPQVNVRTYVRGGGRHGVRFLTVLCPRRLPTWGARSLFGVPYTHRALLAGTSGEAVWVATPDGAFTARYSGRGAPFSAAPDSLDAFLHDRYDALTTDGQRLYVCPTIHDPWQLQQAEAELEVAPLLAEQGLRPLDTPHLRYAREVSALCWAPRELQP